MNRKVRLAINDVDVSELLVEASCGHSADLTSMLEAALRKDGERLQYADLRGWIMLEDAEGAEGEPRLVSVQGGEPEGWGNRDGGA
jgi:hypothetical protein